ncbi:MAG TPA: hypothetical protein VHQ44_01695 [Thermoanaerobaculia bacterium]|nr:hypothetical protein [Thermoanaerobaculia bacterium]
MRRALSVLLAAALAAAMLALAAVGFLVERNLPDLSFPRIPGREAKVSLSFDDRGVATVAAGSVGDALRA